MGMVAVVTRHTVPPQDTQAGAGPHWLSRVLFFRLGRDLSLNPRFYQSRKAGTDRVLPTPHPSTCLEHRGSRGICPMRGASNSAVQWQKMNLSVHAAPGLGAPRIANPSLCGQMTAFLGGGGCRLPVLPLTCVMSGLLSGVWQNDCWPRR